MFILARLVGGIKGLFWSPAHIMRALAACLKVLQTPPAKTNQALGPTQFHKVRGLRQTLTITLPLVQLSSSGPLCRLYSLSAGQRFQAGRVGGGQKSNPPAGAKLHHLVQGCLSKECLMLIHLNMLSGPTGACSSLLPLSSGVKDPPTLPCSRCHSF